jgi:hypothetical protein
MKMQTYRDSPLQAVAEHHEGDGGGECEGEERLGIAVLDAELSTKGFGREGEVATRDLCCPELSTQPTKGGGGKGMDCSYLKYSPGEVHYPMARGIEMGAGVEGLQSEGLR